MGTAQFWLKNVIKVSRLIGGGSMAKVMQDVQKFVDDVRMIAPVMDEPELEGGSGVCVCSFVRVANMDEAENVLNKFKENGWRRK